MRTAFGQWPRIRRRAAWRALRIRHDRPGPTTSDRRAEAGTGGTPCPASALGDEATRSSTWARSSRSHGHSRQAAAPPCLAVATDPRSAKPIRAITLADRARRAIRSGQDGSSIGTSQTTTPRGARSSRSSVASARYPMPRQTSTSRPRTSCRPLMTPTVGRWPGLARFGSTWRRIVSATVASGRTASKSRAERTRSSYLTCGPTQRMTRGAGSPRARSRPIRWTSSPVRIGRWITTSPGGGSSSTQDSGISSAQGRRRTAAGSRSWRSRRPRGRPGRRRTRPVARALPSRNASCPRGGRRAVDPGHIMPIGPFSTSEIAPAPGPSVIPHRTAPPRTKPERWLCSVKRTRPHGQPRQAGASFVFCFICG